MRKALLGGLALVALGVAGPALADGPSGSHEEDTTSKCIDDLTGLETPRLPDGTCAPGSTDTEFTTWDNQVTCGAGTATPAGVVYAGSNGVEVCNDGAGAVPLQGRIIATSDDGGYIAADGDADNSPEAQGWIRIDQGGVRCGDMTADDGTPAGAGDATHPGPEDTQEDCG